MAGPGTTVPGALVPVFYFFFLYFYIEFFLNECILQRFLNDVGNSCTEHRKDPPEECKAS